MSYIHLYLDMNHPVSAGLWTSQVLNAILFIVHFVFVNRNILCFSLNGMNEGADSWFMFRFTVNEIRDRIVNSLQIRA